VGGPTAPSAATMVMNIAVRISKMAIAMGDSFEE
jgi:hypothetical protein